MMENIMLFIRSSNQKIKLIYFIIDDNNVIEKTNPITTVDNRIELDYVLISDINDNMSDMEKKIKCEYFDAIKMGNDGYIYTFINKMKETSNLSSFFGHDGVISRLDNPITKLIKT